MATVELGGSTVRRSEAIVLLLLSGVRVIGGMALIFFALSLLPLEPDRSLIAPVLLVILCIAAYGWFFAHELRKVENARHPTILSVEGLILVATMFLAVFAAIYGIISAQSPGSFTEPLGHFTAFYFALTVLATVGFGDITPVSDGARLACMVQMALDLAFIAAVVKVFSAATQRTLQARSRRRANEEPAK